MKILGVQVPKFTLKRLFELDLDTVKVRGLAEDDSPFDIFREVKVTETLDDFVLNLGFHGNYEEPDLQLVLQRALTRGMARKISFELQFDFDERRWN